MESKIADLWRRWHRRANSRLNRLARRLIPEYYITWPGGGFMAWGHLITTPLPLLAEELKGVGAPDRLFARP